MSLHVSLLVSAMLQQTWQQFPKGKVSQPDRYSI